MPCKRVQLLSSVATAFWNKGWIQQEGCVCCSASVAFWETSDQLRTVLRLVEVFRLFWPAQPPAGGRGTRGIWPRPCACGILRALLFPAGAGIASDCSDWEAAEVTVTFSPYSQIPIFRHRSGWAGGLRSPPHLACVRIPPGLWTRPFPDSLQHVIPAFFKQILFIWGK